MPVKFSGGTSGNREDASPPVPSSGFPQPIQYTETSGPIPSTVKFQAQQFTAHPDHIMFATPDFMPRVGLRRRELTSKILVPLPVSLRRRFAAQGNSHADLRR